MQSRTRTRLKQSILVLAALSSGPAAAQSIEEIERLAQASEQPAEGLALARSQIAAGNLLEALATLERVLAAEPKTRQASLLRADLLCRIDDRASATAAFARLKARDFRKAEWDAALASCAAPGTSR